MSLSEQLRLRIDYERLFNILEDMRILENEPNESHKYHKLFDQLPALFSRKNLIDYHNFIIDRDDIYEETFKDCKKIF